jgi:hypothetical protein
MTELMIAPDLVPNASGYVPASRLTRAWRDGKLVRMWGLGPRVISGQMHKRYGGGLWKGLDRFAPVMTTTLLDKLEAVGVDHPSSFGDCYHQLAAATPRLKHTYNGMFRWWQGGPWEEALQVGKLSGTWYRYDIVSAYRWAASLGLPEVGTFRACTHKDPASVDGLWVAYIEHRADLPNTLKRYGYPVVISSEELRAYDIAADVVRGVQWDATLPSDYVSRTLERLPCTKESARAYWGRWISRDPLRSWTPNKQWDMPNRTANFIWGWLIVGRVRLKVWQAARDAAHVYVDEVVTPHRLDTGSSVGDWHLKETYDDGITVKRTGWYGPTLDKPAMKTGVVAA